MKISANFTFFISFLHLILSRKIALLQQWYILYPYKSVANDFSQSRNLTQSDNNMMICKIFFKVIVNLF